MQRPGRSKEEIEFLWTLTRDKEQDNLWIPPGGEIEFPEDDGASVILNPLADAMREVKEEVGLDVEPEFFGTPFYTRLITNMYGSYKSEISCNDGFTTSRHGAAVSLLYYLFKLKDPNARARCLPQPDEPEYEVVELRWLTLKELDEAFAEGSMNTYGTVVKGIEALRKILARPEASFLF